MRKRPATIYGGPAFRLTVTAVLLALAFLAASCTAASESPSTSGSTAESALTTDSGTTVAPPIVDQNAAVVETSIEVALLPGEATTVVLDIDGLSDVEAASAEDRGVSIDVEDGRLFVAVTSTADPGDVSFAMATSGCVGDNCGVDVTIDVTATVEEFPTVPELAEPLVSPNPTRIVDTEVAGVRELVDEVLVVATHTFDPVAAASALGVSFVGGVPATRVWQFVTTPDDRARLEGDLIGYPGVVEILPHYWIDMGDAATGAAYPADWEGAEAAKTWHFELIDAPELWFTQRWAPDVGVGVIDGGIWPAHEDFTVTDRTMTYEDLIGDMTFGKFDHGTHVAGLACADDQGVGTVGMAWGCQIYAVDMLDPSLDGFSVVAVHDSMVQVADMGADIVNMSLGGPETGGAGCSAPDDEVLLVASQMSRLYSESVAYASQLRASQGRPDVVWVVSAGNNCVNINYQAPARMGKLFDNVVTVASVDDDGQLSSFSNWGPGVTVAAPGGVYRGGGGETFVWSAGTDCSSGTCVGSYEFKAGTSMAAPIVAGLAALMRQGAPELQAKDLVDCLASGATPVTEHHGSPESLDLAGVGVVNAPAAYACATATHGLRVIDVDGVRHGRWFRYQLVYPVTGFLSIDMAIEEYAYDHAERTVRFMDTYTAEDQSFLSAEYPAVEELSLEVGFLSPELTSLTLTGYANYGGVGWDPNETLLIDGNGTVVLVEDFLTDSDSYSGAAKAALWDSALAELIAYEVGAGGRADYISIEYGKFNYGVDSDGNLAAHALPDTFSGAAFASPTVAVPWSEMRKWVSADSVLARIADGELVSQEFAPTGGLNAMPFDYEPSR